MKKFETVDQYMQSFEGQPKERLEEIRALVKTLLPGATEKISYNIPAYFVGGKLIIYFAGYEKHIGVYPGKTKSAAYNRLAEKYAHGKSTARFPHDQPLPKDIIKQFIAQRIKEEGVKV